MSSSVSPLTLPTTSPRELVVAVSPSASEPPKTASPPPGDNLAVSHQRPRPNRWKCFWQGERGQQLSSTLASTLFHMLAVLILALLWHETPRQPAARQLLLTIDKPTDDLPLSSVTDSIEPLVDPEIMAGRLLCRSNSL